MNRQMRRAVERKKRVRVLIPAAAMALKLREHDERIKVLEFYLRQRGILPPERTDSGIILTR